MSMGLQYIYNETSLLIPAHDSLARENNMIVCDGIDHDVPLLQCLNLIDKTPNGGQGPSISLITTS